MFRCLEAVVNSVVLYHTKKLCFAIFNTCRVLARTDLFGPKKGQAIRGWIKMHYDEFHHVRYSPYIIKAIKSMNMK